MRIIGKFVFLVSVVFLNSVPSNADTFSSPANYSLSVSPLFGFIYGQSEEIVYKYSKSDIYGSQLLWDIKPVFYTGVGIAFGPLDPFLRRGFIAETSLKCGIPIKSGIIEDRDWLGAGHECLTHYSKHDAFARIAILADFSAGYSWHLGRFISLGPFGEFSYMYFSWAAQDGYTQYSVYNNVTKDFPPWNEDIPKIPVSGEGILYKQNWFTLSPGVFIKGRLSRIFSIEGKFSYSPLIYCFDRDDHLLRVPAIVFRDYLFFGHYIQGSAKFSFLPLQNLGLSFAFNYRYISGTRGATYEQQGGGQALKTSGDQAGVGFRAINTELALRIRISDRR